MVIVLFFFFFGYLSSFHFQFWLDTEFLSPSEMPSETVSYVLDDANAYLIHGMLIYIYIFVYTSVHYNTQSIFRRSIK